jgi:MoaA/NifB/PqqE/SkfB family radical SAM enzyme
MARALRLELEPDGVKVFNFYPGPIATPFNENALRENERPGVLACGSAGMQPALVARKILAAAADQPGDLWLDRRSKWLALTGTVWPKLSDRRLAPVREAALARRGGHKPPSERRWRLWQLETSIACNLDCIMCPWKNERRQNFKTGDMSADIWEALRPYLGETASVDFSGGGEPLLHPRLAEWVREAGKHGCRTGFLTNGVILDRELSRGFIQAGLDWIGFSVDGATADVYNKIRKGADFHQVCGNIAAVAAQCVGKKPRIIINFVMMQANAHQLGEIVRLGARLGVDQVNFKQCDVIRGQHGGGYGLFASRENRTIRRYKKALEKARRLAKKSGIETTAFAFVPDELPVCAQDPRVSLFIRHDGHVAPCINLANGGPTVFLGEPATMPTVHYGRLPAQDLMTLWETEACRFYRTRFEKRVRTHDAVIAGSSFEASLIKLKETLTAAREAMPAAPEGCRVCHYLYDI